MTHEELIRKAYIGEAVPGFIHNIGNPLGALLGFVSLIREEVERMTKTVETMPESPATMAVRESCSLLGEFLAIADRSEHSMREILDQFVAKCNKDASGDLVEIPLASLVKLESSVLETNRFFKHKVNKKFSFADENPFVWGLWRSVSQPVGSILMLYTQALQAVSEPALEVSVRTESGAPEIKFSANAALPSVILPDDASFPPILTMDECVAMLNPLANVIYAAQDAQSSSITITFANNGEPGN